jgi:hypothetical protein
MSMCNVCICLGVGLAVVCAFAMSSSRIVDGACVDGACRCLFKGNETLVARAHGVEVRPGSMGQGID